MAAADINCRAHARQVTHFDNGGAACFGSSGHAGIEHLPAIHAAIFHVMTDVREPERKRLLATLAKIRTGVGRTGTPAHPIVKARRKRRTEPLQL